MLVFMFPGQSSADQGMIARALARDPSSRTIADRARRVLGAGASRYLDGPRVPLETNRDVQVATFLATQMHLCALHHAGMDADVSLGLSLGEYSHLVHIRALEFEDALALVDARGRLYDESLHGVMVTVLGATEDAVARVIADAAPYGTVVISNYNTPTQHVIAGEAPAVAWAADRLEEEHGAHTIVIEQRVPMHSPLMDGVADRFRRCLEQAPWREAVRPYWPNLHAQAVMPARAPDFIAALAAHVSHPVLWRRSIERIAARDSEVTFVEVGPGEVLHNMLGRHWLPVRRARTDVAHAWWAEGASVDTIRA